MGEDPLVLGDLLNGAAVQPLGEELLALAAAPSGVGSGLDGVHLLLGPAVLQQHAEEAVVAHLRHGGVVTGHDQDLVARNHAGSDEALRGLGADALVVALDGGNSLLGHGVDDAVKHHERDAGVGQLLHGRLQGVVLGQDDDGLGGLVLDDVLNLGDLVRRIGGRDDLGGVLALGVDGLSLFLGVGQHSAGPAVVGIGNENGDIGAGCKGSCGAHEHQSEQQSNNLLHGYPPIFIGCAPIESLCTGFVHISTHLELFAALSMTACTNFTPSTPSSTVG